ncbi:MAG: tetratricopeptide repeat protein [Acidobacteriia bacterium]|nr:tetratricopeptide repeat protein [Terriglobia bacterium]
MRPRIALLLLLLSAQLCFPQHDGHHLSGYVREETTNVPIQSVALELLSSGMRAAPAIVSGMDGEFRFAGLRDGDYYIVATKKGYETATVMASIMGGTAPTILVYLHRQDTSQPSSPDSQVSARQLSIPEKAREAFEKGWKLLYEKSAPEKSVSQFQRAIGEFPLYYEAYAQIGVANYRLAKLSEAEKALRKSIQISAGKYPDALFLLAQMLNDQQRFSEAEPLARQATTASDASWHSQFELARALVGLKRSAEAETWAQQAKELKPDNPQVYLVLANAHIQQQKFADVVQDFDEYLKLAPNAPGSDQIRQRRDRMREALQHASPAPDAPKQ